MFIFFLWSDISGFFLAVDNVKMDVLSTFIYLQKIKISSTY